MLLALKKNGGVVGVNFYSAFLSRKDVTEATQHISQSNRLTPAETGPSLDAYALRYYAQSGYGRPKIGNATLEDAVACVDHIARLIGVDHVGIGADFDGIPSVPRGLEDVSKLSDLRVALKRKGYSNEEVLKIMGGNFMRVLHASEN
jgi:membrane dipeptidase